MNQSPLDHQAVKNIKNYQPQNRNDAVKNEYLDGRVAPKHAANRWHNLIASNFAIAIGSRMNRSTCELYTNDMQVEMGKTSICYPDVVVVNGEPTFADSSQEVLKNPTLVVEIISNASKSGDGRTQKLEGFLAIQHIKECLLVNEEEMRVEHYARQNAKQWIYRIYNERDDVISLESIATKISLSELYAQIKFRQAQFSSTAVN
jgi:Uma2 family endonuclease